jgi:hypothetical protein
MREQALCYQNAGLSVLPARLPDKRPAINSWKTYQSRLPNPAEVQAWFAKGADACCLVCGTVSGNLELLDFDCAGEAFAAWSELVADIAPGLLDRLVVESSPSGGWHVVYRSSDPVCGNIKLASRREDLPGPDPVERFGKTYTPRKDADGQWHIVLTLIETRGEGGVFLCAPSPGYELAQGDLREVPVLGPDEREALLRAAWSLDQMPTKPIDRQPPAPSQGVRPGDAFNQQAEVAPILERHGWSLCRDGENQYWRRPGKDDGWSATLKGGVFYCFTSSTPPFEPNQAYSPFAVYALLEHKCDFTAAANAMRADGYGTPLSQPQPQFAINEPEEPPEPETPDPGPVPVELLRCPGFIDQVIDFTLDTAPYPEPTLAFCGALALLASRKVRDSADNRSTLYLLGLANSGSGKDHPRKVNQRILHAVGLSGQIGDSFASAEGIEDRMLVSPAMLFQTDEMDALLVSIKEGKDGRAERMMQTLLKFYSAANALYHMRVKAGKEPETIDQPALSIFGTAIPQHFYESLSAKMLSNGFFARMLVLEAGRRGHGQEATCPELPADLVAVAQWWADSDTRSGNLQGLHPQPLIVPATACAQACQREIRELADQQYAEHEGRGDQMGMALWARAAEKVRRLALIHACSANHQDPMITEAGVTWAWQLVEHQTRRMVAMAKLHVYEGEFDQKQKKAIQAIRSRGGAISQEQMTRALRSLPARERDEVLANLIATRQIEIASEQTGGRPRTVYRIPACTVSHRVDGKSHA